MLQDMRAKLNRRNERAAFLKVERTEGSAILQNDLKTRRMLEPVQRLALLRGFGSRFIARGLGRRLNHNWLGN
jgi:hypothetical protein